MNQKQNKDTTTTAEHNKTVTEFMVTASNDMDAEAASKKETRDKRRKQHTIQFTPNAKKTTTTSVEIKTDMNDKHKKVWNTQESHKQLTKTRAQIKDKSTPASEEADNDQSKEESHYNSKQVDNRAHFPGLQSRATNKILEAETERYINNQMKQETIRTPHQPNDCR